MVLLWDFGGHQQDVTADEVHKSHEMKRCVISVDEIICSKANKMRKES